MGIPSWDLPDLPDLPAAGTAQARRTGRGARDGVFSVVVKKIGDYMAKALKTTFHKRKVIMDHYLCGVKIPDIAKLTGCTYFQVYNVIRHRVKQTAADTLPKNSPGESKYDSDDSSENESELTELEDFQNPEAFFEHQVTVILNKLSGLKLDPTKHVRLLKELMSMQRALKILQIENAIKRPDAMLIVNIIKRLAPRLSDEDIIKLIEEEKEKIKISDNA